MRTAAEVTSQAVFSRENVVTALHLNDMAEYDRPVGIGTLVTVDSTVPVDVPVVAAAVRARSR